MDHGLSTNQINELSCDWAVFGHSAELRRFFTGTHGPDDITYVVDSLSFFLDESDLPEPTKQSLYRSLIDSLPLCSLNTWSGVLSFLPDDASLWLHAARVAGNASDDVEADLNIYFRIMTKLLSFQEVELRLDDAATEGMIKSLLRHIHANCSEID